MTTLMKCSIIFIEVNMAGNKMSTKTKGKEDKNKTSKSIVQGSEENEDLDFSLIRKPILTSVTGFAQARKIFDLATEEVSLIHHISVNSTLFILPT